MSFSNRHRPPFRPPTSTTTSFTVGQRICISDAPESYGYNGRTGTIVAIDGLQISVLVDNPPDDIRCTTFYREELTPTNEDKETI